jgi:hypothetical protein
VVRRRGAKELTSQLETAGRPACRPGKRKEIANGGYVVRDANVQALACLNARENEEKGEKPDDH